MEPTAPLVFTRGHGACSLDELVEVLESAQVKRVLDVRAFPGSRRHPQFGRVALEESLPARGIAYEWRGDVLGGRRRPGKSTRHPAWKDEAFRAYADALDQPPMRAAIEKIVDEATRGARDAVMRSETVWWRCHRWLISDALVVRGARVVHLHSPTSRAEHKLSQMARIDDDGWPVWDVGFLPGIVSAPR
jgi:uncharacterized protein (DUF488 family)